MKSAEVIILAGGLGKRMQSELPKVLNTLKGRPLIDYVVDAVYESLVCDKPIVVVGKARELVMNHVANRAEYAIQEEQLGTGHAVLCAKNIASKSGLPIIVLYGDMPFISAETIRMLVDKYTKENAILVMATAVVSDFLDWRAGFFDFGRIVRDEGEKIVKIVEKKDATESELLIKEINPSYFCANSDWLFSHLASLSNNNAQGEFYLTDIVNMATTEGVLISSVSIDPKEAIGINTAQQLGDIQNSGF